MNQETINTVIIDELKRLAFRRMYRHWSDQFLWIKPNCGNLITQAHGTSNYRDEADIPFNSNQGRRNSSTEADIIEMSLMSKALH